MSLFKKGMIPWNKGTKGVMKVNSGSFKKGCVSNRKFSIGAKRIRTSKRDGQRRFIKIEEPNVWIEYAKFVWIQNNGKIPKGFLIHHIDGDKLNDDIDNLAMLTRSAHINLHRQDLK